MLSVIGFLMIITFVASILSGRLSAIVALIAIPIIFALLAGFGSELRPMMMQGIEKVAPTGVLLMFAILYFAVMNEAGVFEPLIQFILKIANDDPLLVVVGTAILAMVAALDGDGTTTYMITATALLPLYRRLQMNPMILACVAMLAFGVMNMLPWGGPMARAVTALGVNMQDVFVPLIPVIGVGLVWTLVVAVVLGQRERRRLKKMDEHEPSPDSAAFLNVENLVQKRANPALNWINLLLTIGLLTALVAGAMPLPVLFTLAFALALMINFPQAAAQREFLQRHASSVILVVIFVFASGIFTGILSGTKMIDAMAQSLIQLIPVELGKHFAVITAFSSLGFTYFMANDPFYYGVLPIIAKSAASYGVQPVQIARASILGMPVHAMSPLMAATYLLLGMTGVEYRALQRYIFRWALASSCLMIIAALAFAALNW